jgi:NitT/TauT family transport system substrate-binding protein
VAWLVLLSLLLAGWPVPARTAAGDGAPAAAPRLRLVVSRTPLSLPLYVADSQGLFTAEGLAYEIREVQGGHRAMQAVLDGGADLATTSEAVVMFNSLQRSDFVVLASFVTSDNDIKVVVRRDVPASRIGQLAGRRVGTVQGAASAYYLDTALLLGGVEPAKVQVRNLAPEKMAAALAAGEVDAVAIWEPVAYEVAHSVPGAHVLPRGSSYRLAFNLVMPRALRGVRDADLVKLLRALDKAQRLIAAQPRLAQEVLRKRLGLDQAFIDWIWPDYRYRLSLDQQWITTIEGEARWALQEGHARGTYMPNYLDFLYSSPLRSVNAQAVSVIE